MLQGGYMTLAASAATSVLDEATKTLISNGFSSLQATVTDVIGIAVPVAVGCVALVAGVRFALKQLKGVINNAS